MNRPGHDGQSRHQGPIVRQRRRDATTLIGLARCRRSLWAIVIIARSPLGKMSNNAVSSTD